MIEFKNDLNGTNVEVAVYLRKEEEFKPIEMYDEYKLISKNKKTNKGIIHFWRNPLNNPKWIVNIPFEIKDEIHISMSKLRDFIIRNKIKSVLIYNDILTVFDIEKLFLFYEDDTQILDSCNVFVCMNV